MKIRGQDKITVLHRPNLSCPCVTVHRPALVEVHRHHIIPLYAGGKDTAENVIEVCPNTHYAAHALMREYERAQGIPAWEVRRQFPEFARRLAAEGWQRRSVKSRLKSEPKG